jgi:hypothetical protein
MSGDNWGIEKGGNARDAIEALKEEEDPFPQYGLEGEGGEGGSAPINSHTFAPATGGQTVFAIPLDVSFTEVIAIDHDGAFLPKSRGFYSVSGRNITVSFGAVAQAVVTAIVQ